MKHELSIKVICWIDLITQCCSS